MTTEREMSLREWCDKLPPDHRANKQLKALLANTEILKALYAGGVDGRDGYYDSLRDAGLLSDDEEDEE